MFFYRSLLALTIFLFTLPPVYSFSFYVVPMLNYERFTSGSSPNVSNYYGIAPKLVAGVGNFVFDQQFFVAGEAFVIPVKPLTTNNSANVSFSIRPDYSYGIDFIPGMMLDYGINVFGILGFVRSNFNVIGAVKSGAQLGAGGDIAFNNTGLIVRAEYVHSRYYSSSTNGSISSDELAIGVVFKFGEKNPC